MLTPIGTPFHKLNVPRGYFPPRPGPIANPGEGRLANYPGYRALRNLWRQRRRATPEAKAARADRLRKLEARRVSKKPSVAVMSLIAATASIASNL